MGRFWMVRAGMTGRMAGRFERMGFVGIEAGPEERPEERPTAGPEVRPPGPEAGREMGPGELPDLLARRQRGDDLIAGPGWVKTGQSGTGQSGRDLAWPSPDRRLSGLFTLGISVGDAVATYDPSRDEYIVGRITGRPVANRGRIPGFTLLRSVEWEGRVSQTLLGAQARAALGRAETLFEPGAEALSELRRVLSGPAAHEPWTAAARALEQFREKLAELRRVASTAVQARVCTLDAARLHRLTVGLLGAMGLRAHARRGGKAPGAGDAGDAAGSAHAPGAGDAANVMDSILASPDGFGLGRPLVRVEMKAGKEPVDSDFVAAMVDRLAGDMSGELTGHMTGHMTGMIICPAGFDDEARQVARRAPRAVVLVDAEELTALLEEHYHAMSPESRAALPLSTLYLPLF